MLRNVTIASSLTLCRVIPVNALVIPRQYTQECCGQSCHGHRRFSSPKSYKAGASARISLYKAFACQSAIDYVAVTCRGTTSPGVLFPALGDFFRLKTFSAGSRMRDIGERSGQGSSPFGLVRWHRVNNLAEYQIINVSRRNRSID